MKSGLRVTFGVRSICSFRVPSARVLLGYSSSELGGIIDLLYLTGFSTIWDLILGIIFGLGSFIFDLSTTRSLCSQHAPTRSKIFVALTFHSWGATKNVHGSRLINLKTQLQFGKLGVTAVAATVRGTADEVRIQNGAQSRQYELKASQYEKDRHFFLSQFFRDRYDQALRNLPTIQSGVSITRVEVYVTNDNRTTENLRNVVTLMDLGEPLRLYQQKYINRPATAQTPAANDANAEYRTLTDAGAAARDNLSIDNFLQGSQGLTKNVDFEREGEEDRR